jgi:NADH-quinone oxidoreductase subunit C
MTRLVPDAVFTILSAIAGEDVFAFSREETRDPYFRVKAEAWVDVAKLLRHEPSLQFDFLQNLTAIDWVKADRIEVVYHLFSYMHRHSAVVKIDLPRATPRVASVASVWRSAEWNEREQFDLFGVEFIGHPDLRRILMPDDWRGHPMRKDYREAESYRGMSTRRPNPLELLPAADLTRRERRPGRSHG